MVVHDHKVAVVDDVGGDLWLRISRPAGVVVYDQKVWRIALGTKRER